MRILSIHIGHDASACILKDGIVEKYFLAERFTRVKHDSHLERCYKIIFDEIKELGAIDVIAWCTFNVGFNYKLLGEFLALTKDYLKYVPDVTIVENSDHHLSHACQAFYNSGFRESAVVVVDGLGSEVTNITEDGYFKPGTIQETESIFKFNRTKNELLYKNLVQRIETNYNHLELASYTEGDRTVWDLDFDLYHAEPYLRDNPKYDYKNLYGVGLIHDFATILTGNDELENGKIMGLSSYGEENENFKNIFLEGNTLDNDFYKKCSPKVQEFLRTNVGRNGGLTKENYKPYADFCYEVQIQTQRVVGDLVQKALDESGSKNICIGGGYGMNIIANRYYTDRFPNVNFYFEPIATDSVVSIGGAYQTYVKLTDKVPEPLKDTFIHGIDYDISKLKGVTKDLKQVAKLLYENKSIGVYNGYAEGGQRALGNRSILFNALEPRARDIVNNIKKREWYRPFAAVVLEEDANIYFDLGNVKSDKRMTICFPVREEYVDVIPGVTHVDNTCRIQTVSKSDGYLYELLSEFKKLSGHGVLLNTSFNLAGDPLVENPKHAFETMRNSTLDGLYFVETEQMFFNLKTISKHRLPTQHHVHISPE